MENARNPRNSFAKNSVDGVYSAVILFLIGFGAFFVCILGISQFIKGYFRFGGLLFACSFWLAQLYAFGAGLYDSIPHLILTHVPFVLMTGPLILDFAFFLTAPSLQNKLRPAHFVPAAVSVCLLAPFFLLGADEKLRLFHSHFVDSRYEVIIPFLLSFCIGHAGAYTLLSVLRLRILLEPARGPNLKLAQLLLIGLLSLSVLALFGQIMDPFYKQIAGAGISLWFVASFLIATHQSGFLSGLKEEIQKNQQGKYLKSRLNGIDLEALETNLATLMTEDRIFCDETISLTGLALRLNLKSHQLSEYLNVKIGKNFIQFVNEYRVDYAANQLIEKPNHPVLRICYDAGFNSKSSFYAAFTRAKGMNPLAYRKENRLRLH